MIPGIVAAAGIGSGQEGGGNPYPGSVAVADFLLGIYFIDGVAVTAADVIDRTDLIDASGFFANWDNSGEFAVVQAAFLAKLIASSWTIVIEAIEVSETGNMTWLNIFPAASGPDVVIFTTQASSFGNINYDAFAQASCPDRPNLRRIAATLSAAGVAISCNGGAVVTDETATTTPSFDSARIGAQKGSTFPDMKGHIRRIIVYDPVANSELPGLSTP